MPKEDSPYRNRFGSAALTARLEGFLPWFFLPLKKKSQAFLQAFSSLKASPFVIPATRRIMIKGLERTGTGFCEQILRKNIAYSEVIKLAKHEYFNAKVGTSGYLKSEDPSNSPYYIGSELIKYIICVRHPYSWAISYESFHVKWPHPGITHPCDRHDYTCYIESWNAVYNKWLNDIPKAYGHFVMRYEDLLQHPRQTLNRVCSVLNLECRKEFQEVKEYINNYSFHPSRRGEFSRKDYYLKKKYLDDLSPETITRINSLLDKDLVRKLGYSLVEP